MPISRSPRILAAALLLLARPLAADPVAVRATPVPLDPADPKQRAIGRLLYRGGLRLTADDPRFGGLSSLRVLPGGERIVAVSDEGYWLSARLVLRDGFLEGVADVEMGPLLGPDGKPPEGKDARDAESLALLPDGGFVVGFERQQRLLHYPAGSGRPDGVPVVVPPPPGLDEAPFNGGIEALDVLRNGGLFALTEYWIEGDRVVGWMDGPSAWKRVGFRFERALRPSDGAVLPSGDVLLLERAYNPERGVVAVRILQVAAKAIRPGAAFGGRPMAEFPPHLTLDNYEGIAVSRVKGDGTRVLIVSDDNFSPQQRTLLLMFVLN